MKIDLHTHSSEGSSCGTSPVEEMVQAAIRFGLNAMVITDHDRLFPQEQLAELNEKYSPFKIFGGIEININTEHIIVLGSQDRELEDREWSYEQLHGFVRERNGFIILAHPYRFTSEVTVDVYNNPPDAIETNSLNMGRINPKEVEELLVKTHAIRVTNSDAHQSSNVGMYYIELLDEPQTDTELVSALRRGTHYVCRAESRIYEAQEHGAEIR